MTEAAIRHYFQDFPAWCAIKNITEPKLDTVIDWAAELVADNFISEEEAAELAKAAKENKDLMKVPSLSGDATVAAGGKPDESAATLGAGPVPPLPSLKKSVEAFAGKAREAVKAFYDSNSVMVEDCEGDVLALNNAIAGMQSCVEKAAISLYSIGKALSYQKNEDTMKAISLLGDAIKELAGDEEGGGGEEEAGAPPDSLSSEVSAIYNEEPTAPNAIPNPADVGGEGGEEPPEA